MVKKNRLRIEELSRMMVYILGHKPYEFGLVPDAEGFISFKELLWAFNEEPGWTHVRQGSINEVLLSENRYLFEAKEKKIRVIDKRWTLDLEKIVESIPKLLFMGIRKKAHPTVIDKGLFYRHDIYNVLSSSREMATRLGKRRDRRPVILEIMAAKALEQGLSFYRFGNLFLVKELPAEYIAGPPVPKDFIKTVEEKPRAKQEKPPAFEPGTFILKVDRDPDKSRNIKGKKRKGWKEEARKIRRKKR
jgi:putative RNA 2'-phosphotransferase